MTKAAFIGLGVMGYPWRGIWRQPAEGHVYNRNGMKADGWLPRTRAPRPKPREAAEDAEFFSPVSVMMMICVRSFWARRGFWPG